MRNCLFLFLLLFLFLNHALNAQIHVGIYHGGVLSQVGAGTDPEKKIFGELRFLAGDIVNYGSGIEILGHYNWKTTEWYNIHGGLMVGFSNFDEGRFGVPIGLSFKPLMNQRQFAILIEGTPLIGNDFALRANLGLRYTFRKE